MNLALNLAWRTSSYLHMHKFGFVLLSFIGRERHFIFKLIKDILFWKKPNHFLSYIDEPNKFNVIRHSKINQDHGKLYICNNP